MVLKIRHNLVRGISRKNVTVVERWRGVRDFPKHIYEILFELVRANIVAWFLATGWAANFQLTVRKGSYTNFMITQRTGRIVSIRRLHMQARRQNSQSVVTRDCGLHAAPVSHISFSGWFRPRKKFILITIFRRISTLKAGFFHLTLGAAGAELVTARNCKQAY